MGFHKRTAGAETNVAIGLARLGLRVGGRAGSAPTRWRAICWERCAEKGVACDQVVCDADQRTGFLFKGSVDDGSDPPIEYHRRGSAASLMGPGDVDATWLRSARHLHATGVFPALSASTLAGRAHAAWRRCARRGRTVSFDPNLRPALWPSSDEMRTADHRLAAQADWVLPGLEEGRLLTGERSAGGCRCVLPGARRQARRSSSSARGAYFDGEAGAAMSPASRSRRWSTRSAPATVSRSA
jgi:2-dehydro-3-deoxygluconokinase